MTNICKIRLISLILAVAGGIALATAADKPVNFVVILVDDMGWTGLSGYGSDLHRTPNIDRLAERGMKFTSAYASASICTPTRAALLTGKYPARLKMTIWHEQARTPQQNKRLLPPIVEENLSHEEVTIAEVLRSAGYKTGHVGKWHLGDASHYPETHGFDFTFGGSFWGCPATFYFPYRGLYGRGDGQHYRYIPGIDASESRTGEYLTDRLTDEAVGFIDRTARDPFLLYMAYYTVHTPIEGKPDVAALYEKQIHDEMIHRNAHYAAMHEALDDNVGRILEKLDQEGLTNNTAVILTSDNGGFINRSEGQVVTSNAPLRSGKGSLYEGGVRVPLIVHWPGITAAGSTSDEPVATMDLYPTILEMAGLSGDTHHNAKVDGVSLVPLLTHPQSQLDREALYWHYPHYYQTTTPVSAVRQGNWKLLEYLEDQHIELYDIRSDPGETRDMATAFPEMAKQLRDKLTEWRNDIDAPMPVVNPKFK